MNCCCTATTDIGCFSKCDTIDTSLVATQTGTHTIQKYPDLTTLVTVSITSGNNIIFSASDNLNEDGTTIFRILNPDGSVFTSGTSDCFKVDIFP